LVKITNFKLENQAISAQYSKQVSLQCSYSHKIQVLPAAVIIIGVCCNVLWLLIQFVCSY